MRNKFLINYNLYFSKLIAYLRSNYFLAALVLAISVWILVPVIDVYFLQDGTINQQLFHPESIEVYTRFVISISILITGFIVSFLISHQKQADEELLFTQFAVEHASDAIYWVGSDAQVLYVNTMACDNLGYSKEELKNMFVYNFNSDFPKEKWGDYWKELKEKKSITLETHHKKKDGTVFPVEITANYLEYSGKEFSCAVVRDITERKKTEEILLFERFAIEHAGEAIYWVGPDARILYGNEVACDDLGYSKKELENKHVYDFNDEYTREMWFEFWDELKIKKSIMFETVHMKKDGTIFPVEITGNYLEYSGNKFACAFVRDISERKKAEELLLKRDRQLTESQSAARLGSWDMDLVADTLDWSDETYRLCDKSPELYTPSFEEFARMVHPDDLEIMYTVWNRTVAGSDEPYYLNIRMINDTGRQWVMEAFANVERDEEGNVTRIYGTTQDITERKKAEEELRESNERFRAAFVDAAIGIALVSLDYTIIEANQAFCEMLGYTKEELAGISIKDFTYPEDLSNSLECYQDLISGKTGHYHFEQRFLNKQGNKIWVLLSVSLVQGEDANPLYAIAQVQDITQRKKTDEQLSYQANHDALTGLINRHEFERRAKRMILTSKKDKNEHALCFMDLDQFKVVNDTCGHTAGDEMLRQLTEVLGQVVRKRDTLARLGGDEFGILMEHCSLDNAYRVAASIQKVVQDYQFSWKDQSFRVGVSIGLVPITDATANITELLKQADAACYMAKDMGRNRIHVYSGEDVDLTRRQGEMQWVARLHRALEEDSFCLFAQPIVSLDNRTDKHYELLIRLRNENGEHILPGAFLAAAERYNLIMKLDYWVIKKTFNLLKIHPLFVSQICFISINISGQSLANEQCLNFIIRNLSESGIDGNKICFEITETAAISNLSTAIKFIEKLKKLGCQFALDDFGSGLSSFGYLKNLPVDYLKIDGMFVRDIVNDPIDHAMVKSINEIGQVMGMQTIAEFVENDEIKGMLREIGVNYAQGFSIGKPLALDELLARSNNDTDIKKARHKSKN